MNNIRLFKCPPRQKLILSINYQPLTKLFCFIEWFTNSSSVILHYASIKKCHLNNLPPSLWPPSLTINSTSQRLVSPWERVPSTKPSYLHPASISSVCNTIQYSTQTDRQTYPDIDTAVYWIVVTSNWSSVVPFPCWTEILNIKWEWSYRSVFSNNWYTNTHRSATASKRMFSGTEWVKCSCKQWLSEDRVIGYDIQESGSKKFCFV